MTRHNIRRSWVWTAVTLLATVSGLPEVRAQPADPPLVPASSEDTGVVVEPFGDPPDRVEAPPTFGRAPAPMSAGSATGPLTGARQMLRLLDVSDSHWASFRDGQPVRADDQEALVKILYRMAWLTESDIARWLRGAAPVEALRADPAAARGEFFALEGRVHHIARQPLLTRQASLFEFDEYYQLDMELAAGQGRATVFSRTVPEAWRTRRMLNQRAGATGLFLKVGEEAPGGPRLLFAAGRIAWFPDRAAPELGIGPDHVWLASRGLDIGLFDTVRLRNRGPITAEEREAFYALLQAVGRATPEALVRQAQPAQLASLLRHPEREHGRIFQMRGAVRRITRVVVEDADVRERFQLADYYQLDVLVPLSGQTIEVRGADGESGPIYRESFPFTYCALRLPESWRRHVGAAHVNLPADLPGVFFKLWSYSNPLVASFDEQQRQLSPLLVTDLPIALQQGGESDSTGGVAVGVGFLVVLALLWCVVAWMHRSDRSPARRRWTSQQASAPLLSDADATHPPRDR